MEFDEVSRSVYVYCFVFLLLFAVLLLVSERFSRFSVPRSMRESGEAIDRAAVEKATLINPQGSDKARFSVGPGASINRNQKTLVL
jgi:hypothetical protein